MDRYVEQVGKGRGRQIVVGQDSQIDRLIDRYESILFEQVEDGGDDAGLLALLVFQIAGNICQSNNHNDSTIIMMMILITFKIMVIINDISDDDDDDYRHSRQRDKQIDEWIDRQIDTQIDRWIDRYMDR